MAFMTMKTSRKWIRIVCLLVNVSIMALLFFPISFGTPSPETETTTQDILNTFLSAGAKNRNNRRNNPFESMWNTIKDIVGGTTSGVKSPSTDGLSHSHSQHTSIDDLTNRRGFLMEKTLEEHYASQFSDYWPELKKYMNRAQQQETAIASSTPPKSTSTAVSAESESKTGNLRWRQPDKHTGDTSCCCFSESVDSHWSFQWCPEALTIYQGRRQGSGVLRPNYNLGSVHVLSSETPEENKIMAESVEDANRLATTARMMYPTAESIRPYVGGDICVEGGSKRRSSVVVIHNNTSEKCREREGREMILENVEEIRLCQYILHVCKARPEKPEKMDNAISRGDENTPPPLDAEMNFLTESGMKEINETLHYIQNHVTDAFTRKSRADARGKTRENIVTSLRAALPPLPKTRIEGNLKLIKDMFTHAYDSYMYHGYPAAEVKPITCSPADFKLVQIPGLTLIDSLDTLVILGNYTEFARAVERLKYLNDNVYDLTGLPTTGEGLFSLNHNVSVFETNIRVLGGLLSAHQLAIAFLEGKVLQKDVRAEDDTILVGGYLTKKENYGCDEIKDTKCQHHADRHWAYDGFLLNLAKDIGDRLLPAFKTKTGIPYGTVNLLNGIPEGETPIASLAGGGTLSLEMELLSRLTGNNDYGRAAKLATRALWMRRSPIGLLGKHICTRDGYWAETLSGIGSNSDSFYEYLIKHHILFPEDSDFWLQLLAAYGGLHNQTRIGEWYGDVDMYKGRSQSGSPRRVLEALMAFYPGMQVLLGEVTPAARTLNSFFLAREYLGFLPERFQFGSWRVDYGGGKHLLRPELLESAYFLHRASKGFQTQFRSSPGNHSVSDGSGWLWSGDFALHLIEKLTRSKCGYGSPREVSPETSGKLEADRNQVRLTNEMPSYFLSETLKYLYLLFDENNILHTDEERDWVFTTEAHPIHHEQREQSVTDKLVKQKEELKLRIRRRLEKREKRVHDVNEGLIYEKWTATSKIGDFVSQLEPLMANDKATYRSRRTKEHYVSQFPNIFPSSVERLFSHENSWSPFDVFNERFQMTNPAYLTFQPLGSQLQLISSCPNLYNSNFLWLRALNGGIADYSDAYKSRTIDTFSAHENDMIQLGSIDALGLHGAGVHIEHLYDAFFRCPVRDEKKQSDAKKSNVVQNGVQKGTLSNGSTRFEMGNGMGSFDISSFPGGSGFYVKHVESGETYITTLIEGALASTSGPLILVYAKDAETDLADQTTTSKGNKKSSPTSDFGTHDSRSVVLADIHGNSYSCSVKIIESTPIRDGDTCTNDETGANVCVSEPHEIVSKNEQRIVREFPCSPALFGPSNIANLEKIKNLEVHAKLQAPDNTDLYGCGRFSISSSSLGSENELDPSGSVLSIVHRGDCTFQEKAFNKKFSDGAEGVIVINGKDGDDLFVMSGGGSKELAKLDTIDYPVTVLFTNDDGQELLDMMKSRENGADSELSARISIAHDRFQDDSQANNSAKKENQVWPRVRASSEWLEIYSKSGWGIQAVQNVLDDESGDVEKAQLSWQLYLFRHNVAEDKTEEDNVP